MSITKLLNPHPMRIDNTVPVVIIPFETAPESFRKRITRFETTHPDFLVVVNDCNNKMAHWYAHCLIELLKMKFRVAKIENHYDIEIRLDKVGLAAFNYDETPEKYKISVGGDEDYVIVTTANRTFIRTHEHIRDLAEKLIQTLTTCSYFKRSMGKENVFVTTHA